MKSHSITNPGDVTLEVLVLPAMRQTLTEGIERCSRISAALIHNGSQAPIVSDLSDGLHPFIQVPAMHPRKVHSSSAPDVP